MSSHQRHYHTLFLPVFWDWGPIRAQFQQLDSPPPEHMISNVNVIPYVGDQWVMIRLESGAWEIAGGTCEPDEHYLDTARREHLEEAGAWKCESEAPKPYRPHLPHPNFYRLV